MADVRVGLQYGSIVGPKTKPRKYVPVTTPLTSRHPDEPGVRVESGFLVSYDQSPVAEGEIRTWLEQGASSFDFYPRMFIAVNVNQTGDDNDLEWIEVDAFQGQQVGGVLDAPEQVVVLPSTDFATDP